MPLNRWVTTEAPAPTASAASWAVAALWPRETTIPWRHSSPTRSIAPGSSGANVIIVTGPGVEQPRQQRAVGRPEPLERMGTGAPG